MLNRSVELFAKALAEGRVTLVDLTQTLSSEFPCIELPPQLGPCAPFVSTEVSRYDERGPAWYWNDFSCNEHTGTHFDAPVHWITGKDIPNNTTDTLPVADMIASACVIDCSTEASTNPDFLLTVEHVLRWESVHGQIEPRSWVLMRTDWSKRKSWEEFRNANETGQHTPGPDVAVVRFLIEERSVLGFGTECIGTDAGQAFLFDPPYPCHHFMHGAGLYGLQCLCNLDRLPSIGALIIAAPLKLKNGSGSPLRVLALV